MKVLQKHKPAHFAGVHGRMTVKDHRHHCCYGDGRHSETNHQVLGNGSICQNQLDQRQKHSFSQSRQERRWGILHLRQNLSHECSLKKKQETGVQCASPFPLPLKPVLLEALLPRKNWDSEWSSAADPGYSRPEMLVCLLVTSPGYFSVPCKWAWLHWVCLCRGVINSGFLLPPGDSTRPPLLASLILLTLKQAGFSAISFQRYAMLPSLLLLNPLDRQSILGLIIPSLTCIFGVFL